MARRPFAVLVQLDKSRQRGRDHIFVRQNTNSFRNIDDRRKPRSIAPLARNRKFESISLQQRVVQTSFHATGPRASFGSRLFARACGPGRCSAVKRSRDDTSLDKYFYRLLRLVRKSDLQRQTRQKTIADAFSLVRPAPSATTPVAAGPQRQGFAGDASDTVPGLRGSSAQRVIRRGGADRRLPNPRSAKSTGRLPLPCTRSLRVRHLIYQEGCLA